MLRPNIWRGGRGMRACSPAGCDRTKSELVDGCRSSGLLDAAIHSRDNGKRVTPSQLSIVGK